MARSFKANNQFPVRSLALTGAVGVAGLLAAIPAANAQGFVFTTTFAPVVLTNEFQSLSYSSDAGSYPRVTNGAAAIGLNAVPGPTAIVLTNFTAVSNRASDNPANLSQHYSIVVSPQNAANRGSGTGAVVTNTFYGERVNASVSATTAGSSNTFFPDSSYNVVTDVPSVSDVYDMGNGVRFEVDVNSHTPYGVPGSGLGAIGGSVAFLTPEPGLSAMLAGFGAGGLFLLRRRRRV